MIQNVRSCRGPQADSEDLLVLLKIKKGKMNKHVDLKYDMKDPKNQEIAQRCKRIIERMYIVNVKQNVEVNP